MIAVFDDTPYRIVLLLHILAAFAAFAPMFTRPFLLRQYRSAGADNQSALQALAANSRMVHGPALIAVGVLGFALQGLSSGVWTFGQVWMIAAIVVWVAMNGVAHAVLIPAETKMAEGDQGAARRAEAAGLAMAVLLIIMLWLMVAKPL